MSISVLRSVGTYAQPTTRTVTLPGRGPTRVWECAGPPGAATVVLVHGVTMTTELNWGGVLETLGHRYRVLAIDQRGHGDDRHRRVGGRTRFRLEDCADDLVALADASDVSRFVAVGYSMGGMIAQLLYRRHPERLAGMVLCSTAASLGESPLDQAGVLAVSSFAAAAGWHPAVRALSAEPLGALLLGPIPDPATRRWVSRQLRRTDLTAALSAVQAVCAFSAHGWIRRVQVPAAVVVTTRDRIVSAARQRQLAAAIPAARTFEIAADHGVCVTAPAVFGTVLHHACASVAYPALDPPAQACA